MVVQHNISAMNANRYYGINNKALAGSLEKLSSGYAINRAGDNAAGLAVSEKMRAQIGGLTQASKNAEDGISLVQTMEGALQETDSILQRMRTLAVQSANGNYQDDVDRDAIQLEFDQLNDELNQIADTDFNGVVMLNGGEMADGLKAVDIKNGTGKFDYANKEPQVIEKAKGLAQEKLSKAQEAYETAAKELEGANFDLTESGYAPEWNTVNNNFYNKAEADGLWQKMSITDDGTDAGNADTSKIKSVEVTFEKQSDGSWAATKGFDQNGNEVAGAKNLTATVYEGNDDTTGLGGIQIEGTSINLNFDAVNANEGDTVTVVLRNDTQDTYAPTNMSFNQDSVNISDDAEGITMTGAATDAIQVSLPDTLVKDADMTQKIDDAFSALEDAEISVTYTKKTDAVAGTPVSYSKENTTTKTAEEYAALSEEEKVGYTGNDEDGYTKTETTTITPAQYAELTEEEQATWTASTETTGAQEASDGSIVITIRGAGTNADDPADYTYTVGGDSNAESFTITGKDGKTAEIGVSLDGDTLTLKSGDTTLANVKVADADTADLSTYAAKSGNVSANLSVSAHSYEQAGSLRVTPGNDKDLDSSKVASERVAKLKEDFENAQAEYDKIENYDTARAWLEKENVSKSDAFDQSRAKMTYTDNMTLQVGARTKDAVNFTFSYNTQDLGGLKANLNCSSRADGLNTANLSVNTAKDANDAIDQIDKALNKVNMVRATFGAAQNRLEHKINNIDTNTENMTAAESRIRDTQMDKEMMKFTSAQILSQASQSMLAQANSLPQGVLQLLG